MTVVVLGLGTNLGDRLAHLRRAVRALRAERTLLIERVSAIYQSDALVPPDAPAEWNRPYLNLALRARFDGTLDQLLDLAKRTELALGRKAAPRWAPREADIDILAFGSDRVEGPRVTTPHRDLAERPFALLPMADVWPEWVFPAGTVLAGQTARDAARRWRGDSTSVPFRTTRSGLVLTELVGILNLTPDSFSDGGLFDQPEAAIARAHELAAQGATVIDLGAESTRPNVGGRVSPELEWERLGPVLRPLGCSRPTGVLLSVDTRHPVTARRALDLGVDWINDVGGFGDPALRAVVQPTSADLVVTHSLTIPPERGVTIPVDADPIAVVSDWAEGRWGELEREGIDRRRVILVPGIGFGKTPDQNVALIRDAGALGRLGLRTLVGHSRKSFLAKWFESGPGSLPARDQATATLAAYLLTQDVDYLRVHDPSSSARALRAWALVAG
jgi:2-amino-4-hydroxy-6-hydroxymethyldihydropteridine diphosphokinase/dihydropteroate synthase